MTSSQERLPTISEIDFAVSAAAQNGKFGARDATIIKMLHQFGLRPQELVSIRWQNIDFKNATISVDRIKGSAATEHTLDKSLTIAFRQLFKKIPESPTLDDFVFTNEQGQQLTTRSVQLIVEKAGKLADLTLKLNPSLLRRTCAFELAQTNASSRQMKTTMGFKHSTNAAKLMRTVANTAIRPDNIPKIFAQNRPNTFQSNLESSLTLQIPASTANLGPGLDTLGLALTAYTTMTFNLLHEDDKSIPRITLLGDIANLSQESDRGHIINTVLKKLPNNNISLTKRLRITIDSDIPLGCGLGSSGTVILGTVLAANLLTGQIPTRGALLNQAFDIEGHPETMAASLCGGLVACSPSRKEVFMQTTPWPKEWLLLVVVPQFTMKTLAARAVLPKLVPISDAIFNIQKTAQLICAVWRTDEGMFKEALADRLHESYRNPLVPDLAELRHELRTQPILGCVLSGAGSSTMIVVHQRHLSGVTRVIQDWISFKNQGHRLLSLEADQDGMRELVFS
ncbi:MAG: homoserine kinase [Candidatus Obscuribacterales bacterium]